MWFETDRCDLSYAVDAPCRFESSAVVPASPERVFAVLADPATWPQWFADFQATWWTSPPPHGVGATREVRMRMLGARERFLAWEPGRRFSFAVDALTLPIVKRFVEDVRLEPAGAGRTRVTWTACYTPTAAMRLVHPLARPIFARMFARALAGLGRYLERLGRAS